MQKLTETKEAAIPARNNLISTKTDKVNAGSKGQTQKRSETEEKIHRQIGAFGIETMGKLIQLRVLIIGLRGAGIEAAKNIILAGPKSVTLLDDAMVEVRDLGTNFYCTEGDVGRVSRAQACVNRLGELNSYVQVSAVSGNPLEIDIGQYSVVVCCCSGLSITHQTALNKICREKKVGFISGDCFGLGGQIFVDFGEKFVCFDKDGEEVKSAIIAGITTESDGITVFTHNDKRHGFHDDDHVVFREVEGMIELNDPGLHLPIRVTGPYSFKILMENPNRLSGYTREGIVTQVKKPVELNFISLEQSRANPVPAGTDSLPVWDLGKFGRAEQLHVAMAALRDWIEIKGKLPGIRDKAVMDEVLAIAKSIDSSVEDAVVENLVAFASCEFGPMTAFTGGVVAQEVVKFTGKYHPLQQSLYFDMFEVAASPSAPMSPEFYSNDRYSDLVAILGKSRTAKLHASKLFLVGSGALGCEFLKALSLSGIGIRSAGGKVVVTDMDRIETSNLNRQFLFRAHHVGQQKSTTAAKAATEMNPDFHCLPMEVRVGPETEDVFDDVFWANLDCVVNALDNVQARLYMDSKCVWFNKPLLESGTLGTKANVQVVIPNLTQSYGDSQDPPEESIPLCTLKNFPNQIEHTIEWARDLFHGLYTEVPGEVNSLLKARELFLSKLSADGGSALTQVAKLNQIHALLSVLTASPSERFAKCVEIAVAEFTTKFDHSIAQLVHTFPVDHRTTEGNLFWSGPKRLPGAIGFSADDELHLSFVAAASNLIAYSVGVACESDSRKVAEIARTVAIRPFVPKEMKIKTDDKDTTVEGAVGDEAELGFAINRISALLETLPRTTDLAPHEFEKDDDSNFHIDFIAAAANLRARNYKIPEVDKFRVKLIAGKIIPAIATTTAMAVGLVTAELIKILTNEQPPIELFKNSFVNLALPIWILSEPLPPIKTVSKEMDLVTCGPVRAKPEGFTPWEKILVDLPPAATVNDLIQFLANNHNIDTVIVSAGNSCLYNVYLPKHKARLEMPLVALYEEITKVTLPPSKQYMAIEVSATDKLDDVDVVMPSIKFRVRK